MWQQHSTGNKDMMLLYLNKFMLRALLSTATTTPTLQVHSQTRRIACDKRWIEPKSLRSCGKMKLHD